MTIIMGLLQKLNFKFLFLHNHRECECEQVSLVTLNDYPDFITPGGLSSVCDHFTKAWSAIVQGFCAGR